MDLFGAQALVTGASSGIGRATALALADAGCSLVLTGRDEERLDDLAQVTGGDVVVADLRSAEGVGRLVHALASYPSPDLVVHSAGIGHYAPLAEHGDDDVERLLATNLLAPVRLTRALLPAMVRGGAGRVVFVTSIAGVLGTEGETAYAASKGALGAFAASLRAELGASGVGVTTVVPGAVATPFFDRRGSPYERRFPRPVPAERVADALVRGIRRERPEVLVPDWLRVPVALHACAPQTYARLARRWG